MEQIPNQPSYPLPINLYNIKVDRIKEYPIIQPFTHPKTNIPTYDYSVR